MKGLPENHAKPVLLATECCANAAFSNASNNERTSRRSRGTSQVGLLHQSRILLSSDLTSRKYVYVYCARIIEECYDE